MHLSSYILPAFLVPLSICAQNTPHKAQYSTHDYYVLELDPLAPASLSDVTLALGVEIIQQAGELRNHWLVRTSKHAQQRRQNGVLDNYRSIQARAASYGDSLHTRSPEAARDHQVASSIRALLPQVPRRRTKRAAYHIPRAPPPVRPSSADALAARLGIVDPIFPKQWHFINENYPEHMMNVTPVWELMGITGKGVYVAMVDDGVDFEHDDIKDNFFAEGSYDFNDHEPLPKPKLSDDHHGTRCAGEIAAVRNDVCGVGIAYNSKIAGLRILSGPISDVDEASALNYAYQNTSIYSCSWGPPDDGKSMDAPSYLIQKAVLEGILNGRGGKGSIFVFASGNGAAAGDQCNFDGYTNSIFSITVGAVDHKGLHPYYSEACAANMIVTYSSGSSEHIHTTDLHGKCTSSHGGTSAAAPIASGVFALALEARPELTWRDMQYLCIHTALMVNPEDPDWEKTASGRNYSYKYGYGKLDAWRYVNAAKTWELVKPQVWIDMPIVELGDGKVSSEGAMLGGLPIIPGGVESKISVPNTMLMDKNFEKLEHVNVKVWINHTTRGDVEVELVSPNGIRSVLAGRRQYDKDKDGFPGWTFMSIKHWDENPVGDWTIRVSDQNSSESSGKFLGWTMSLFGSAIDASLAVPYELLKVTASPGNPLPPQQPTSTSGTKTHPKPTDHLPGDHGTAEGESDKPSFDQGTSTTPDQGYFKGISHLLSNSTWLIVVLATVALFSAGVGVYLWRRRVRNRARGKYTSLPAGDDVPMRSRGSRSPASMRFDGGRTKELYDAFGEVSDDEADEETSLRPYESDGRGIEFHSGFLMDDDPRSTTPAVVYRDEPVEQEQAADPDQARHDIADSQGSGDDGSWEHASQQGRVE